jgi:hypothetical protein
LEVEATQWRAWPNKEAALKNLIYAINLDPSTRQELEREARRIRYEVLKRYIVAPLVAVCKRTLRRRLATVTECAARAAMVLNRGTLMRIENGRGRELRVTYGSVWVTQHGSPEDVFLDAGASFRIDRDGLTLVMSYGHTFALLTLERPVPVSPAPYERMRYLWRALHAPARRAVRAMR